MAARILLIDDDKRLADMVSRYLAQAGFQVMHCFDARSGLALLESPLHPALPMPPTRRMRDGVPTCPT